MRAAALAVWACAGAGGFALEGGGHIEGEAGALKRQVREVEPHLLAGDVHHLGEIGAETLDEVRLAGRGAAALWRPASSSFDVPVHGIGRQVDFAGPGDGAIFEVDLAEKRGISESGENPGFWRKDQPAHVHDALKPVEETDLQFVIRQCFEGGGPPGRLRHDGRIYGSGLILSGVWF